MLWYGCIGCHYGAEPWVQNPNQDMLFKKFRLIYTFLAILSDSKALLFMCLNRSEPIGFPPYHLVTITNISTTLCRSKTCSSNLYPAPFSPLSLNPWAIGFDVRQAIIWGCDALAICLSFDTIFSKISGICNATCLKFRFSIGNNRRLVPIGGHVPQVLYRKGWRYSLKTTCKPFLTP